MRKPRLLFVAQVLPFPPDGGVAIRTFNVLRLLAARYEITALAFYRRAVVRDVSASVEALREFAVTEAFPIEEEFSRARLLWNHLRSLITRRVYTTFSYESGSFRTALRYEVSKGCYDIVHFDSMDLSAYLSETGSVPTVCVHHNVESVLLKRRAAVDTSAWRRWYLRLQSTFMEREERRWCPRVSLNVAVSEEDAASLRRIAPDARVTVVPNGVDTQTFQPAAEEGSGIVFVGGMTWFPNKDALEYFATEILPLLKPSNPDLSVTWVGRAHAGEVDRYRALGITLTGYVDDIRPFVHAAGCYVVPLRIGGGTRLKILDAWAMGKAVVSTSIGCEGLGARDGWNILVRDDPVSFTAAVREVLADAALRQRIGVNARAVVEARFSWLGIGVAMLEAYEGVRADADPK